MRLRKVLQLMPPFRLFSLAIAGCLLQAPLVAIFKCGPISMELVSEQRTVMDGKAFWVGWRIVRDEGWHTYWKHPGDVGVPPRIKWSLPDGMRAGELLYAPPQRVRMGQVGAHGNYGETLFLCKFEPIVPLGQGSIVKISGKASWLACSRQCLPGFTELSIEIPVGEKIEYDPFWRPRFESLRGTFPRDAPANWSFRAVRKSGNIELFLPSSLSDKDGRPYFFCFGRQVRSHSPQVLRKGKSGWILSLKRSSWSSGKERELSGLLYRKEGWGGHAGNYIRVRAPVDEG
jgi:DsbC/DsbD-like thiol-disulfide interchange protein